MIGRVIWIVAAVAGIGAVVTWMLGQPALLPGQCTELTLLYTGDTNGWLESCSS